MKYFIISILSAICITLTGQTILLEENVAADTIPVKYGPNLKNFSHLYFDYGFFADKPEGKGGDIMYGSSYTFTIGFRYKYKLNNTFSLGYDIHFTEWSYRLKQNYDGKLFPDSVNNHKKEKLVASNLGAELYFRINYGRRGNHVGNFIDMGGYANWIAGNKHYIVDEFETANSVHAKKVITQNSKLLYVNNYAYGVCARIGFNRYMFSASYRLSDFILPSFNNYPEMPRLSVGIQLGIY